MNYNFEDVIDMEELNSLIKSLNSITNIPVSVNDVHGKTLLAYGCRDVCKNFYKKNETTYELCKNNQNNLINCLRKNEELTIFKCNYGIFNILYPVYFDGKLIAVISAGQFFYSEYQMKHCLKIAETYSFNQKEFIESVNNVPVLSNEQISKLKECITDFGRLLNKFLCRQAKQIELQGMLENKYKELESEHYELCKLEKKLILNDKRIIKLAYYDDLTGLPNKVNLIQKLKLKIKQVSPKEGKKIAAIFIDLDDFKNANSFGYVYGDKILIEAGNKLKKCISCDDVLCRYGEDEFLILKSEFEFMDEIHKLVKRIFDEFKKPWEIDKQKVHINTSMGISVFPDNAQDADSMIEYADMALSRAKNKGKNRAEYFDDYMYNEIVQNAKMQMNFVESLKKHEFFLTYQPQVNVETGRIFGIEALVRWNTPNKGVISPAEFIPAAEQNGFIIELGEWVLKEACRQNKFWQDKGYGSMIMSVNVSERQLQNDNFVDIVESILKETKLEPQYLELELTESSMMKNINVNICKLQKLKEMGIKIALDDFGTGYSSLNYLRIFPLSTLKIDKSFISNVCNDSYEKMITNSIMQLGQNMKLDIIAEGVEIKEQLNFLKSINCYNIQGYLFYKPCLPGEVEKIILPNMQNKCSKNI